MLAMVLAAASLGEALKRSLVFTLGHAITLTLVVTGTIPPVGNWIEPIIAATIALGGYLAFRQKPAQAAFIVVPLVFGLIHGLGFAAAAADKLQGIDTADLAKLLLGFNVGVEAAQAGIILLTAGMLWALAQARLETAGLRRILGLLIAIAGTAIMVARIWSLTKGA
jgi:hydrogenase/urease accessory protein HupE